MPVTKKNTAKQGGGKKIKKSPAKKIKKSAGKKPRSHKSSHVPQEAVKKISIRQVALPETPREEFALREAAQGVDFSPKAEEANELEQFLKDFSSDQAIQAQDEKIEHQTMMPVDPEPVRLEPTEIPKSENKEPLRANFLKESGYESIEVEDEDSSYTESLGRSVGLYKKIAYFFIALVTVLLVFIFFFSVVKLTIILIPDQERVQNNLIFDVYDKKKTGINDKAIKGVVEKTTIEDEAVYPATGQRVIGQEAIGEVTIINNYSKNQPLVATTRLLTSDNKLFRLKNTVNVPAGGSIKAEIYADKPSQEMAIGPSRFTIPGLWAGLQDQIYAESETAVTYQEKIKKRITQEDIDNSIRNLKQKLLADAKLTINKTYSDYNQVIFNIDENSIVSKIDGKVDQEIEEFGIVLSADVVAIAFNKDEAIKLARQQFDSSISGNRELLSFNEDTIEYSLDNYDYTQGVATLKANFEGKVSLRENSEIIDKNKIVGLKEEQLKVYLDGLAGISGYEIKFYPSFISKVPKLTDRIEVQIKK